MIQRDKTSPLPYQDNKPQGSADFYFAVNATFRFLLKKRGVSGWISYLRDMATDYYRPVWTAWREDGLPAVATYLQAAFDAEPQAKFEIVETKETVTLRVIECPALKHLKSAGREIVPEFCQHCYHQYGTMASNAGLHMRLRGGNGSCTQTFSRVAPAEQNLNEIHPVR
jgi:hypothetical protein